MHQRVMDGWTDRQRDIPMSHSSTAEYDTNALAAINIKQR